MKIGFKRIHPDAKLPSYAHEGDAGMDVYAVEDYDLKPHERHLFSTGLCADIPTGFEIQVRSRSGLALKKGIFVLNSPGTIDQTYTGIIGIILMNLGEEVVHIQAGDRIAQLVVAPVTSCEIGEVSEVTDTERGTGGFGSTGI